MIFQKLHQWSLTARRSTSASIAHSTAWCNSRLIHVRNIHASSWFSFLSGTLDMLFQVIESSFLSDLLGMLCYSTRSVECTFRRGFSSTFFLLCSFSLLTLSALSALLYYYTRLIKITDEQRPRSRRIVIRLWQEDSGEEY
jgi:hypothetical protein